MAYTLRNALRYIAFLLLLSSAGFCNGYKSTVKLTLDPNAEAQYTNRVMVGWVHGKEATWYGEFKLKDLKAKMNAFSLPARLVGQVQVMRLAQELWNGLAEEYEARGIRFIHATTKGSKMGSCVVAVMWDPVLETFFASTIPYGPRKLQIVNDAPSRAPVWYKRAKKFMTDTPAAQTRLHAEDGVFFEWEAQAPADRIVGDAYSRNPHAMIIGAWGSTLDTNAELKKGSPSAWGLCKPGGDDSRDPSCFVVAAQLGVDNVPGSFKFPTRRIRAVESVNATEYDTDAA